MRPVPLPLPAGPAEDAESAFDAGLAAAIAHAHAADGGRAEDRAAVEQAARLAAAAIREGQVCAVIDDPDLQAALQRSPAVCDGEGEPTPLVLQAQRLYLFRYWQYERLLATRLAALNAPTPVSDAAAVRRQLDTLFPGGPSPDWQKLAAVTALTRRLCVLSGGPGTGKTTTVVRLLAALLSQQADLRVALAAPTGKAAARIKESVRLQIERLPVDAALRERLPGEAQTVHRLLGYRPGRVQFRHHAGQPLPYDLVIVDEASMLDLALAAKLLDAIPPHGRLILLGDKDQLAAVEAGAVFADLSRRRAYSETGRDRLLTLGGADPQALPPATDGGGALDDAVVWLEHSYRFDAQGGLGRLARCVNAGEVDEAMAALRHGAADWRTDPPAAEALLDGYAEFVETVRAGQPAGAVLAAFDRFRVLCATRHGAHGSLALNEALALAFRQTLGESGTLPAWYPGRPVMLTRNDYALRLFNGDIGVTLADADGRLRVYFPAADGDLRAVLPARLAATETAFALTVHKSQGSEFERVDLVLDARATRGLSRELIYTGLTRARTAVRLWAAADVLAEGIGRRTERHSALFRDSG